MGALRILAVAPVGGYGGSNTSLHRLEALRQLGHEVSVIDSDPGSGVNFLWRLRFFLFRKGLPVTIPDSAGVETQLRNKMRPDTWDVLWLDKAVTIDAPLLAFAKQAMPNCRIVGYAPDDMFARHNQSQQFLRSLPLYDSFITTKSYNVQELTDLGCRDVLFVGNAYDPAVFRPLVLAPGDEDRLGGDVGFIGSYEKERAASLLHLAQAGLSVRVWGGSWENFSESHPNLKIEGRPIFGDDYARACGAFKINLCFLRKINRDLQTTRSIELPACGCFMMAERSDEHLGLFEEGVEAEFFDSNDELLAKCRRYLAEPDERARVARAGLKRCQTSGYDNAARLKDVLRRIFEPLDRKADT